MPSRALGPARGWGLAFALLGGVFLPSAALAGQAPDAAAAKADAKRFGLDREGATVREPAARTIAALKEFRRTHGSGVRVLFHPRTGAPEVVRGFAVDVKAKDPETAARRFLDDWQPLFGVDTRALKLAVRHGAAHLLFQQSHLGLPVEFSRIGVHRDKRGRIHYVNSNFDPAIAGSAVPNVGEAQARAAALAEAGSGSAGVGTLVWLPDAKSGETKLAWKFKLRGVTGGGLWLYWIDARNGTLLLRYDDLRYQTFVTSGTITGGQYPVSPFGQCEGAPTRSPFAKSTVWLIDGSSKATVGSDGFYSFGQQGRVFALLRGPNVVVSHEKKPNASYDNGSGQWFPFTTQYASPHPYPPNANIPQIITGPSEAVRVRTRFSSFAVGEEVTTAGDGGEFDDDMVRIEDASGVRVADYFGSLTAPFLSAEVVGRQMTLRLISNEELQANGFEIDVSSYFKFLEDATSSAPVRSSYDLYWSSAQAADGRWDEMNAFYQINAMHDFLAAFSNPTFPLDMEFQIPAMVQHSNGFQNAFYNSDTKNMYFGGGIPNGCQTQCGNIMDCSWALDTTVVRHEYTHFAVDRIFPIANFGEMGAFSEMTADYFALTSLDTETSQFGLFAAGGPPALRDLDDGIGDGTVASNLCANNNKCRRLPQHWTGEIHDDSLILSQAVWAIRQRENVVNPGQKRADNLAYQTMFYFPGSFREYREAFIQADIDNYGTSSVNPVHDFIVQAFTVHGISGTVTGEDLQEPNDGIQTATDMSGTVTRTGNIYPVADTDFYVFPARAGVVEVKLSLPGHNNIPGEYLSLGLTLEDGANTVLATKSSTPENSTINGNCPPSGDCWTGDPTVTLTHRYEGNGPLFVAVHCGTNDFGSIGGCASTENYSMTVTLTPDDALAPAGMTATQTGDQITFSLPLTAFALGKKTPLNFDAPSRCQSMGINGSARLRDHNMNPLYDTDSTSSTVTAVALTAVSGPTLTGSTLSGTFKIHPGTSARYPAVGTVFLEIMGVNQFCERQPVGVSGGLGLGASGGSLKAWNNVMNPVKGDRATLRITISGTGRTTLKLYTLRGEHVKTLLDRTITDSASVDWDGRNENGSLVASGIYLAHVEGPGVNKTQKVVVVK